MFLKPSVKWPFYTSNKHAEEMKKGVYLQIPYENNFLKK